MDMNVQELKAWMDEGRTFRLVDVREQEEWEYCKIEGAELLSLSGWLEHWEEVLSNPREMVVVYCHHGMRSASAVHFLRGAGFESVENLEGGIDAWSRTIDPGVPTY